MMNWNGIDYFGYDVVPQLVIKNQNKYGAPNIQFFQGDAIHTDLPPADLLICKDVLQHLPHEDIIALVAQLHKFKYCLITNDIGTNQSTSRGGYRGLDLTLPPFSLKGVKILTYPSEGQLKQVLLITQGEM